MTKRVVSNRPVTDAIKVTKITRDVKTIDAVKSEKNKYLLGITLDATLSFTKVYPQVFYYIAGVLKGIKERKVTDDDFQICYSLVLLHDEPEVMVFGDGSFYTSNEDEVIDSLKNIDFYGGQRNGLEDLNDAISKQLTILDSFPQEASLKAIQKGLLLFTDSMPVDRKTMKDFTEVDEVSGLRYASFFANTNEFMPLMKMVNSKGNVTENDINISEYNSLEELLEKNEEETKKYAKETAAIIINAFTKE